MPKSKQVTIGAEEGNTPGAVINPGTRKVSSGDSSTREIRSRAVLDLDEKTTLIAAMQGAVTDLKGNVDGANTLVMALDPATSTETEIDMALDAYEALAVVTIENSVRDVMTKLRA